MAQRVGWTIIRQYINTHPMQSTHTHTNTHIVLGRMNAFMRSYPYMCLQEYTHIHTWVNESKVSDRIIQS